MSKPRGWQKMPTELRLEVYEHYFAAHDFSFTSNSNVRLTVEKPALLKVSELRDEALELYLKALRARIQALYDRLEVLDRAIKATHSFEVWQAFQAVFEEKDALEREEMRVEKMMEGK